MWPFSRKISLDEAEKDIVLETIEKQKGRKRLACDFNV